MAFFKSSSKKREEAGEQILKSLNWSHEFLEHHQDLLSISQAIKLGLTATITAMAYDPLQSLLVVGTADGHFHLWGSPPVSLSWLNRPAEPIKFMTIKSGSPLLCAIDSKNCLTVYNLSKIEEGEPLREYAHSVRSTVTCFDISPAHSHMFLGLEDGTIDCYDLDRGIISPYRIRNLWFEQEELHRKSGTPRAPKAYHIPICTDIKIHPLDLNLILIAHDGGVTLYDLKQQSALRSFQLIIPAGSIGGISDPNDSSILEERKPSVICLCFRPDGLIFAAGYSDGCIAFWSIEHELPLLVRTTDSEDVLKMNWQEPRDVGSREDVACSRSRSREPIFRMAWSFSPRASQENKDDSTRDGSKLIVLGGLLTDDPSGVHVFHFPKYPSKVKLIKDANADGQSALRDSLVPVGRSVYLMDEIPDDFLLIPRKSPYFDNAEDPVAILISSTCSLRHDWLDSHDLGNDKSRKFSSRTVRAYTFPSGAHEEPREYLLPASFDWIGCKSVLISQMFGLSESAYKSLQHLPQSKSSTKRQINPLDSLPLRGGQAQVSPLLTAALQENFQRASKLLAEMSRKHRVLITIHMDYKIRFWDCSIGLLLPKKTRSSGFEDIEKSSEPANSYEFDLKRDFPRRLDHLTIDLTALSRPPFSSRLPFKLTKPVGLHLNPDSLDLLITLANGDFLVYNFHHQSPVSEEIIDQSILSSGASPSLVSQPSNSISPKPAYHGEKCAEVVSTSRSELSEVSLPEKSAATYGHALVDLVSFQDGCSFSAGFSPTTLIKFPNASKDIEAVNHTMMLYAFEDLGFLAIANPRDGWLRVIDLRKFVVLFDEVVRPETKSRSKNEKSRICTLHWVVARAELDPVILPRLLVGFANGLFKLITLTPTDMASIDNWTAISTAADSFQFDSHAKLSENCPIAVFTFNLDGSPALADLSSLRNALSKDSRSTKAVFQEEQSPTSVSSNLISIIVCSQSVTVTLNLNGPQLLNRIDISSEPILHASIISYLDSCALLLIDQKRCCHIFSLPRLDLISRKGLPIFNDMGHIGMICTDYSADVLEHVPLSTTNLCTTIFGRDAIYYPDLKLYDSSISALHPPKARLTDLGFLTSNWTSNLLSWLNSNSQVTENSGTVGSGMNRLTGSDIDSILAGPSRPPNKKSVPKPPRRMSQARSRSFMLSDLKDSLKVTPKNEASSADHLRSPESSSMSRIGTSGSSTKNRMNQNIEGLDERSDRLRDLNEHLDEISQATQDLLSQAKRIAQQQATKSTLSAGFSNVKSFFK